MVGNACLQLVKPTAGVVLTAGCPGNAPLKGDKRCVWVQVGKKAVPPVQTNFPKLYHKLDAGAFTAPWEPQKLPQFTRWARRSLFLRMFP